MPRRLVTVLIAMVAARSTVPGRTGVIVVRSVTMW